MGCVTSCCWCCRRCGLNTAGQWGDATCRRSTGGLCDWLLLVLPALWLEYCWPVRRCHLPEEHRWVLPLLQLLPAQGSCCGPDHVWQGTLLHMW